MGYKIMEDKKESVCGVECGCGQHGCTMGHHKHKMFKKLFMLAIILIAFCFGVQFGELKGELRAYHGSSHMRSYGNFGSYPMPMMGGIDQDGQYGDTWTTPAIAPTITIGTPAE
jgi:hypothetical protein